MKIVMFLFSQERMQIWQLKMLHKPDIMLSMIWILIKVPHQLKKAQFNLVVWDGVIAESNTLLLSENCTGKST